MVFFGMLCGVADADDDNDDAMRSYVTCQTGKHVFSCALES